MSNKTQVMIVDDSAVVRQTISELLNKNDDIEVIAVAQDPIIAQKRLGEVRPDVIILDIEMPRMDGLTFLQKVMAEDPIPIIICSSKAEDGSGNALRALELGAVDIIQKPYVGTKQYLTDSHIVISDAVRSAANSKVRRMSRPAAPAAPAEAPVSNSPSAGSGSNVYRPERHEKLSADVILPPAGNKYTIETTEKIVVIGASTGGTEAVKKLLIAMPLNAPPIVVVQHMPEKFTRAFADRLNNECRITVAEATNNQTVLRGQALIAPGNKHTLLKRSGARYYVEVREGPLVSRHRPSVDVLFRSASRFAGKNTIGVIMTGMGDDGAKGMAELKSVGSINIAQSEQSCVVFGMPNEAIKLGAVDHVLDLEQIPGKIMNIAGTY